MRRLQRTIGMMALLLLGIGVSAAQAEPQFAGSWVLDRSLRRRDPPMCCLLRSRG